MNDWKNCFVCIKCNTKFSLDEPRWKCNCGGLLDICFKPAFPMDKIKNRKPGMWRYREAVPIENDKCIISLGEGFTPILEIEIAGKQVLVKQEHLFPSGSYKDRGASVLISKINDLGIKHVVEDSSGNAGAAIAAYCAAAGIGCDIYVPADTSYAKLSQVQSYGANLFKIPGSREDTAAAVLKAAQSTYYASHSWNPFFFHGTKTFAFEVSEQLDWNAPDTVILPAGNGTLLLGASIGFNELHDAGIIKKIPRLIAVQAEHCAPLFNKTQSQSLPFKKTIAEGIAIAEPVRGPQMIDAVKKSSGFFITVSEDEIEKALFNIHRKGFYIEPTSAAVIAGVQKYLTEWGTNNNETVVSAFTGHGLKKSASISFNE